MRISIVLVFTVFFCGTLSLELNAQFAPAAGKPGSTAIFKDDTSIVQWATSCKILRGRAQINQPDSGYATVGTENAALGKAGTNGVVSLGDGGIATLTFASPITNKPGPDFAVFENAFLDTFLELAFVEVSSDGQTFVRFPSTSLTDTSKQVEAFGALKPEQLDGFAGKYRALYGVPFDLEQLKDSLGIDIQAITHVRIIDVIGTMIDSLATRDAGNRKVNDPWPTPFPSSGFDLDAVGVIHPLWSTGLRHTYAEKKAYPYPNPLPPNFAPQLQLPNPQAAFEVQVVLLHGGQKQTFHHMEQWQQWQPTPGLYGYIIKNGDAVFQGTWFVQ